MIQLNSIGIWIKRKLSKSNKNIEYILWDMKTEQLFDLCRETGGEQSPYFYKLQEHLKKEPKYESS